MIAGRSLSHGFATLMLTANLPDRVGDDPVTFAPGLLEGIVTLGKLIHTNGARLPRRDYID